MDSSNPDPLAKGDSVFRKYHKHVWAEKAQEEGKLFPHQREAIACAMKHLKKRGDEDCSRKAVMVLPTGTGKTGIALTLPYALKSTKVLIITPRDTLRSQMFEAATASMKRPGVEPFLRKVGLIPKGKKYDHMMGDVEEAKKFCDLVDRVMVKDIIIANAQMFTDRQGKTRDDWTKLLESDLFDLVIVDEAHFHPALTWKRIADHFHKNPKTNVIFLTATPYRGDQKPVCEDSEICCQLQRSVAVKRRIIRDVEHIRVTLTEEEHNREEFEEAKEIQLSLIREVKKYLDIHDQTFPLPYGRKHKALMLVWGKSDDGACEYHPSAQAARLEEICKNDEELKLLNAQIFCSGDTAPKAKAVKGVVKSKKLSNRDLQYRMKQFNPPLNPEKPETFSEPKDGPRLLFVNGMLREGFDYAAVSVVAIAAELSMESPAFEQFVGRAVRTFGQDEPFNDGKRLTAKLITHSWHELDEHYERYKRGKKLDVYQIGDIECQEPVSNEY